MKLTLVATCMFGLEKLLGEEIDALGLKRIDTMDGRVTFEGEESDIPRANIWLRCAERVLCTSVALRPSPSTICLREPRLCLGRSGSTATMLFP